MLTEFLVIVVIVCLGVFALWAFLKVVKLALKLALVAVILLLFYWVFMFFKGLFGG